MTGAWTRGQRRLVDGDGLVWCREVGRDVDVDACLTCRRLQDVVRIGDRVTEIGCRSPEPQTATLSPWMLWPGAPR